MRIVICGGGPAAAESAMAAHRQDAGAEILVLAAEDLPPYRRPALSGLLAKNSSVNEKSFFIRPAGFFADNGIELRTASPVAAVDGGNVLLADGSREKFDRLILAAGGRAVRLPLPGADLPHVFTLRTFKDMETIRERMASGVRRGVIIGGGVLGLEIAESMLSWGIETTVLEAAPRLFPGRLDEAASAALAERLAAVPGLHILCGAKVSGISRDAVFTADRPELPADLVIMAAGSRPDLALAESAGILCGRGVTVDRAMRSSRRDIFAAGDAAELENRCFGLYMDAVNSGRVAGTNAAGGNEAFTAAVSPVRFNALGEKLVMP